MRIDRAQSEAAGEKVGGNTGNVIARFPGTIPTAEPIMMSAHMDTVVPGRGVKPIVEGDIIRTDGSTVLGGDDKSGVAVIMEAADYLLKHPEIPHGPIRVCFTCDEEVGRGVDHLDLKKLGADVGYTLDGGAAGELDHETFSADLAVVTLTGVAIHPGMAKGRMVNALRLVILQGAGLFAREVLIALGILAAWAVATFLLALRRFRWT